MQPSKKTNLENMESELKMLSHAEDIKSALK